jgi:SAM-dependent methyltransferase
MNSISNPHPGQGVLQILIFNWRAYAAASAAVCGAMIGAFRLGPTLGRVALLSALPALYWIGSSLLVSHYVYDRYPLYDLTWIRAELKRVPARWINVHCGFDQTSALLEGILPEACGWIVDIFNPCLMTEASIRSARKIGCSNRPAIRASYDALPFCDGSFEAAFSIFAAHELRTHLERATLFGEIARILVPDGEFVVVEHSRDWRNFLAFGPGFMHFFSPRAWRRAAAEAGFRVEREFRRTPFIRVYLLRRPK